MALYLGILLFSFLITGIAIVPFIDFLYRLHFTYPQKSSLKFGTPIGGGILIIFMVTFLSAMLLPVISRMGVLVSHIFSLKDELNVIFFTFISFGLLGLYDDINKNFNLNIKKLFGLPVPYRVPIKLLLSLIVSLMLYQNLHIHIHYLPLFGVIDLGWVYIPVAAAIIFIFSKAFNLTDGLDGLAGGALLICLGAFWAISLTVLDTSLSIFIALWMGSLIAFLYFNVYPARIWLGNAGSISFGATLAVTGLILGKAVALFVIGGLFIAEFIIYYLPRTHWYLTGRKTKSPLPLHYLLLNHGWPEPKIMMRAWLISILFALIGLWLSLV